jgi:hypothetical protein
MKLKILKHCKIFWYGWGKGFNYKRQSCHPKNKDSEGVWNMISEEISILACEI